MAAVAGSLRTRRFAAAALACALLLGSGIPVSAQAVDRRDTETVGKKDDSTAIRRGNLNDRLQGDSQDPVFEEPIGANDPDADATEEPLDSAAGEAIGNDAESGGQKTLGLGEIASGRESRALAEGPLPDPESGEPPQAQSNLRTGAVEPGTRRAERKDPFLPEGFRAGTWLAFTTLEAAIGYATNSSFSAGGKPGAFATTELDFLLRSDWSRHQAQFEIGGSWRRGFGEDDNEIPTANAAGEFRLDLLDGYTATFRGGYDFSTEAVSAPELAGTVVNRPGVHVLSSSAALERTGGRLELALRGSIDRTIHDDGQLSGGGVLSQEDRNNNLLQLTTRLGYSTGAAFTPFVQAGIGQRLHDLEIDRNGNRRDAFHLDLRAGTEIDFGEKLVGEVAVGYLAERFEDPNLETLDAISVNGNIDWSPERDTVVRFGAATFLSNATTPNDNGFVNYGFSLDARRRVRDNLSLSARAALDLSRDDTNGTVNRTTTVGGGFEYWLNRFLALTGRLEYQRLDSDTPGNSFDSTSARLGMAWRR
jgi:hypothetical protein